MPQDFMVRILDTTGAPAAILTGGEDGYTRFSYTRRIGTLGTFTLGIVKRADEGMTAFRARVAVLAILDGIAEFSWCWPEMDIDWHVDGVFLIRSWSDYLSVDGEYSFELMGRGLIDLLGRRRIAAFVGSVAAEKTGVAETIAKELVEEQAGPGAGARAIPGLTVQADAATGPAQTWSVAYKNLLTVVQDIALAMAGDFDVVMTGAATFEFRWYDGQMGADRTATVVFSTDRANVRMPLLEDMHQNEINAVLVGGEGEDNARMWSWRTDPAAIAESPLNRCEDFVDARSEEELTGLETLGDTRLDEMRPRYELRFEPIQTPGMCLDRDYFLGDKVTAEFLEYTGETHLRGYTYTWTADDRTLTLETGWPPVKEHTGNRILDALIEAVNRNTSARSESGGGGGGSTPEGTKHHILSSMHDDSNPAGVSEGSLILGDKTPEWGELVIGGAGELLTSDGTTAGWVAPGAPVAHDVLSAQHGDTLAAAVSRGSLIVGNATPKWSELVISAVAGHILTSDGTDAAWAAPAAPAAHDILSAQHGDTLAAGVSQGSIIVGNATPKWSELVIGANTFVLTSDGTDAAWVAPGAGGAHDILSATHTDTLASAVTRGSIIYGNATPKWAELVIGAQYKMLACTATDVAWSSAFVGTHVYITTVATFECNITCWGTVDGVDIANHHHSGSGNTSDHVTAAGSSWIGTVKGAGGNIYFRTFATAVNAANDINATAETLIRSRNAHVHKIFSGAGTYGVAATGAVGGPT